MNTKVTNDRGLEGSYARILQKTKIREQIDYMIECEQLVTTDEFDQHLSDFTDAMLRHSGHLVGVTGSNIGDRELEYESYDTEETTVCSSLMRTNRAIQKEEAELLIRLERLRILNTLAQSLGKKLHDLKGERQG